ncbi:MAG: amidohydrolase [Dysgonamonadaceae bacterium]|jgi:predicted amidohydrolase YtcJ|nr:amidohydrolase [Dysgonamonadaceae bacterium]
MNKQFLWMGLVMVTTVLLMSCSSDTGKADTIFMNGNIYTVDKHFSKVSIIALKQDKILYVGDDAEAVEKMKGKQTQVVDLKGKTIIPGLIDSHLHYMDLGESLMQIDIYEKPKADILQALAAEVKKTQPGDWIVGSGWSHEVWPNAQWPTKEDLDAVAPDHPVYLIRKDGHSAWVNSKALEIAQITAATPDPQGGEIIRNASGEPSGVLTDTAMDWVIEKLTQPSDERKLSFYQRADKEVLGFGITSLLDAGTNCENIKLLKNAYSKGLLQVRAYELLDVDEDIIYLNDGNKPALDLFDGRLSINCVKLYTDGSLGSRSAWFLEEYDDRKGHIGNLRYTDEAFYQLVKRAREEGFQVATHAIGDAAVKQTIAIYEKALKENPLTDHRYRIEHFQSVHPDDFNRLVQDSIIASMQTVHATSDMPFVESRIGVSRALNSYAWRTIIDKGGIIPNGSDAPVEYVNPYHGFYAAVTRQNLQGEPEGGWFPQLCMTREEALKSFTIWGAYAMFGEKLKGSLEAGKFADFVVLDRDIMTCEIDDIKDTQAVMTVLGGKIVAGGLND